MSPAGTSTNADLGGSCGLALDDWLIFSSHDVPVSAILQDIQDLGLSINIAKSILTPTTRMTYLGLNIDTE
jgi:hypothetical protein